MPPLVLDGTNGVSGVDGTASNPAIEGTDSNTGIFYPAADTVAIGTGGTERLRVDSVGRVGIATTSPAATLDIGSGNLYVRNGTTYSNAFSPYSGDLTIDYGSSPNVLKFITGATERMRLDANGNLGIGTTSPNAKLDIVATTNTIRLGRSTSSYATIDSNSNAGSLNLNADVGNTASGGSMTFTFAGTERARITSGGIFLVGTTNTEPSANNVNGFAVDSTGWISVTGNTTAAIDCNRKTNDGTVIAIRQDGTIEGSISVAGNTVSYNPFLGSHAGAFADWSRPEIKIGTIFETINELIDYKVVVIEVEDVLKRISYNGNGAVGTPATVEYEGQEYTGIIENERGQERDFNKHVKVKINDTPDSKAVYGVFVGWNTDPSNDGGVYNDMLIGAVGNYVIRMAAGQTPEIGDLVKADGTGCAVVQEDDIVRTKTVGKITNTIPQLTYEDGSFLVACVLYCG